MRIRDLLIVAAALCCFATVVQSQIRLTEDMLKTFEFRNLGAFRVGAWVSSIAVPENPGEKGKYTFFVAGRHGGVWKTDNNGTTFRQVFDSSGVNSTGCVQIAPSNPEIVWVGTGESYNARSSHPGKGIFKSTDGGESFKNMGLGDSHHIARVVIHPESPDIVYVAVMGHLFSPNQERGVFKTIDGGKTWKKVLFLSDRTGVIDLTMSPTDPEILYAAAYEKYRYGWHLEAGGRESGILKTTNGGETWQKITQGLPDGIIGRIGLSLCRSTPNIIYALFENLNPKDSIKELKTTRMSDVNRDNYYDQLKGGEVYRSDDGGTRWGRVSDPKFNLSSKAAYSFNQIFADPVDPNLLYVLSAGLHISSDGGKTWSGFGDKRDKPLFTNVFGDFRTFWIDPHDSRHIFLGSDGGLYVSYDGGKSAEHLYNIPIEEIYSVGTDLLTPYNIYCGLQDHEAWRGPSNSWAGKITLEDWAVVGVSDGMYCAPDNETNRWFYTTGQFGQHTRVDLWNGERSEIAPKRAEGQPPYRYTWSTPLILSPHNSSILYTGAEVLLRSLDRGNHWEEISPDLTTNDASKKNGRGHIQYCTITTIAESPRKAGILWVGTDDGRVHVSKNHGGEWSECTAGLSQAGAPQNFWVTRVFASTHDSATAYVTRSGFVFDDFRPAVYRTSDFGRTWQNISSNLPQSPVNAVWEDADNQNLLFLGTDAGAFASINAGMSWTRFPTLPPVPVKDLLVHPRERDLVIGTYGRGLFVTNISPLTKITPPLLDEEAVLFPVKSKPFMNHSEQSWWGNRELMGSKHLSTPNEPDGFEIYYYLKDGSRKPVRFEILNAKDSVLASFEGRAEKGLHKEIWSFEKMKVGNYLIRMTAGGEEYEQPAIILERLRWPVGNQEVHRSGSN